jgi:two-component system sensor histidine kinase HydH
MGVVLVASGVSGYFGARHSAASLTRSLALDMTVAVRRALHAARPPDADTLKEVLGELSGQGLTYVGLLAPPEAPPGEPGPPPRGAPRLRVVVEAGTAAAPHAWAAPAFTARVPPHMDVVQSRDGRLVRVTAPFGIGPGPGAGLGLGPGLGWGRLRRLEQPAAAPEPGAPGSPPAPPAPPGAPGAPGAPGPPGPPPGEPAFGGGGPAFGAGGPGFGGGGPAFGGGGPAFGGGGPGFGGGGPGPLPGPPGPGLAIECAPPLPRALVTRALFTLATDVGAAVLLLAAALFFWRLSRRAERYAAQLEREQRLAALGQMSAVLGHELRNPLASLKGHAQLLLEKLPEDHPGRPGATRVVREAVRLEELAGQILEFVRTGTVDPAPVDPVAPARAAVEAVGPDRVRLTTAAPPPTWLLDRPRLESVLVNLLRNAVAASPADAEVEVHVGLLHDALVYEVRDRGTGLEPGDEERVFEPFFTRRAKGTGLGLAVARRVVEGHGGTITAARREGGGALFRVTLPARPPGAAGAPAASPPT